MADSGALDHLVDDQLIPGLRHSMRDSKKLKEPKTVVTACSKEVFVTATGTIWGYITNQVGYPIPVCISATIVPGLRCTLFSPAKAMKLGVLSTILETGNPHLQSTATLYFRGTLNRGTWVCARVAYVFAPWVARLRCHRRLL